MPELTAALIAQAVLARAGWAEARLRRLVRHASVLGQEGPAQEELAGILEELGLAVRLEPVVLEDIRELPGFSPTEWSYAGRPNVVGLHQVANPQGRSLIVNGHIDVVSPEPVALWHSPPFDPPAAVGDDRGERWISGRGAGDMKGGTVAYLWALAALAELELEPASPLIVQSVIEEECSGNGTLSLCAQGYRADACLIPEPFDQTLLARQVGVLWFRVRVLGKTTHVLGAGRGVNAIERSWPLIQALRALEQEKNRPGRVPASYQAIEHPINLNVGVIQGGDWPSTVPGECLTSFRLGLFPGERCANLLAEVEQVVAQAAAADPWLRQFPPRVEAVGFQAEGCSFDTGSPLAQELGAAHRAWQGADPLELTATCTTDIRHFNLYYNIPATCYGPRAESIHGADERVSLDSMAAVARVLVRFLERWTGLRRRPADRRHSVLAQGDSSS